ncbi:uncharacterized protein BO80DRAFT_470928 [Aspergillus ibericus CBS 121593]|uniref:MFS general substrate transporter n=1 Tax=Aspergillus ibericus CBS 121593 TaxID=1448316 RepID=A0A395H8K3_9EURO|nr:hypothetical protein BO80DRAFT_470928 [Aspergillus ibericus CBS 121593]RAL03208.1 hypothetical protein BO80DRAFT_470928 [Aspergillus ibericus CBS 121593]
MSNDRKSDVPKAMDQAAGYLAQSVTYPPMSARDEKKLLRKLDWVLIPMAQWIKSPSAPLRFTDWKEVAIPGLVEMNLTTSQIFTLSASSIPGPDRYYRLVNWGGLMALRFCMGCLEAIIVPSISLIIAGFYKKSEQPPRNAIVFAALSSMINGFLSWVVGHIPNSTSLAIWQYLYLIVGSISAMWCIIAIIFLPDSPMNAFFLTDQEKYYAVQRLADNKTGIVNKTWKWDQALEAAMDPKTWILFFFNISINIPNGVN